MGDLKDNKVYPANWKIGKTVDGAYDIQQDEIFKKYANKSLPISKKRTRAGLTPYTAAWTVKQQKHLLRRTMFGVTKTDMANISALTPGAAVDYLLNNVSAAPAPPINNYENTYADTTSVPAGSTWVNATYGDGTLDYHRTLSLKSWWMSNIANQNTSIIEKMVLFMSNNYPIEMAAVPGAILCYKYLDLLRTHALGNLKDFIKALSKDGAMLRYLNGHFNVKNSPDENYARELQELFTVGKDGPVQFTEPDVKAAAKVLTGWRVDINTATVSFNDSLHDDTNKLFSSYYNNQILNGLSGAAGANELDNLVDMIFSNGSQDIAKFYARKIYRFFVYYDIDANIETTIINGLAQTLINNNWDVKPMIAQLLKSDHFFDSLTMDCYISSPIEFFAGTFRGLESSVSPTLSIEDQYKSYYKLVQYAANAAQNIGDPPSVSGWPAFYQVPHFHEMWINSDTLPKRLQTTDYLLTPNGAYVSATARLRFDVMDFANSLATPSDPVAVVDYCVEFFLGLTLSQSLKDYYKSILLAGQTSNYYWTNAWNDYAGSPTNTTYLGIVRSRLQQMLTEMFRMAEHHLG